MLVFRGTAATKVPKSVVTIGQFDGLHLGHQSLIKFAKNKATDFGCPVGVVTFYPLPAQIFYNASPIMRRADKMRLLRELKVDFILWLNFNKIRQMRAADFVNKVCQLQLGAQYVVVGQDFRFGFDRIGTPEFIQQSGIETLAAPIIEIDGEKISSNNIRLALKERRFDDAKKLLGRPYSWHARSLGAKIAIPKGLFKGKLEVEINGQAVHAQIENEYLEIPSKFANQYLEIRPIG